MNGIFLLPLALKDLWSPLKSSEIWFVTFDTVESTPFGNAARDKKEAV